MTEKKTPDDWCDLYGLEVRDPDGWRRDNTPWDQPLTLPDFWRRYTGSTARIVSGTDYERILTDVRAAKREDEAADNDRRRLELARTALIKDGYFTADQIGDDIAPRITELATHLRHQLEQIEAEPEPAAVPDPILCTPCWAEHHTGHRTRDQVNNAVLVVGGNGTCTDHLVIGPAPALPGRTPGGIILGNGS